MSPGTVFARILNLSTSIITSSVSSISLRDAMYFTVTRSPIFAAESVEIYSIPLSKYAPQSCILVPILIVISGVTKSWNSIG